MTKIELFTSPTCPFCPGAKKVVVQVMEELNSTKPDSLQLSEYDTFTEEGSAKAREYEVTGVPSIFVSGSAIAQKVLIDGEPSKEELLQAIEMAEGKRSIEKTKGFLEKLFG